MPLVDAGAEDQSSLRALQFGMGWFPEQAGGLNRVFYHLTKQLPSAGARPYGLVAARASSVAESPFVRAFAPSDVPLHTRMRSVRNAVRELDMGRFHVVASHFALYTFPVLDRLPDVPLVVHFHGPWAAEGQAEGAHRATYGLKHWVEQRVYRRAQRFIVLSEAFQQVLGERYGIPEDRVTLVPGGVDVSRFAVDASQAEARKQLGWPLDRPVVLSVRRLARRMGLDDLIAAAESVRRRVPDVLFLVAGKGPQADVLLAQIEAAGLERHVRLLGFVPDDDLPLAYRAADLSVVPTVALEGFGLIAAESLAAGTPVLVTPVGGLPDVVRDLDEQLVLPAKGPGALAEGITSVLMGCVRLPDARACKSFATRYDWPVIAAQTARVYRSLL